VRGSFTHANLSLERHRTDAIERGTSNEALADFQVLKDIAFRISQKSSFLRKHVRRHIDASTGMVKSAAILKGLEALNMGFTEQQLGRFMQSLDTKQTGTHHFEDLLAKFSEGQGLGQLFQPKPEPDELKKSLPLQRDAEEVRAIQRTGLMQELRKKLTTSRNRFEASCKAADMNCDGLISSSSLTSVLHALCPHVSRKEAKEVVSAYYPSKGALQVNYREFLRALERTEDVGSLNASCEYYGDSPIAMPKQAKGVQSTGAASGKPATVQPSHSGAAKEAWGAESTAGSPARRKVTGITPAYKHTKLKGHEKALADLTRANKAKADTLTIKSSFSAFGVPQGVEREAAGKPTEMAGRSALMASERDILSAEPGDPGHIDEHERLFTRRDDALSELQANDKQRYVDRQEALSIRKNRHEAAIQQRQVRDDEAKADLQRRREETKTLYSRRWIERTRMYDQATKYHGQKEFRETPGLATMFGKVP
ncbi:hypothetical protein CYMTET_35219, partial [Cymbomonas tetramitiformis]